MAPRTIPFIFIAMLLAATGLGIAAAVTRGTPTPEAEVTNRPVQISEDG